MPSMTPSLERALEKALHLASDRKHEYATLEHLLFALTEDEDASEVMRACKLDVDKLRGDLNDYMDEELNSIVVDDDEHVHPTAAFQRVVQRAAPRRRACFLSVGIAHVVLGRSVHSEQRGHLRLVREATGLR